MSEGATAGRRSGSQAWRQGGLGALLVCVAGLLACACTMVPAGKLPTDDAVAVRQKEATIVLFRITGTDDGKPINTWETGWAKTFIGIIPVAITGLPAESIPWVENRAPSDETRARGWRYLVLRPGSYRLFVNTPYGQSGEWRSEEGDRQAPSLWIDVPRDAPVLYGGTLALTCSTRWQGSALKACRSEIQVTDETQTATAIARAHFADQGPLRTDLAAPYGQPLPREALRELASVEISTNGYGDLKFPDWQGRAHERYHGRDEGERLGTGCYGQGCGGLVLMFLLYYPVGAALEAREVQAMQEAWGPCLARRGDDLRRLGIIERLRESLLQKAAERGLPDVLSETAKRPAGPVPYKGRLRLEVLRAQFRECRESGTYCFELVVRARLNEIETGKLRYEAILDYSNDLAWVADEETGSRATEKIVAPQSSCAGLTRFCGDLGSSHFETEVRRAVEAISDALTGWEGV